MGKVKPYYGIWHGGIGYGPSGLEDMEKFDSLAQIKRTLYDRCMYGGVQKQTFRYVYQSQVSVFTPAVDITSTSISVYSDPEGGLPDMIVEFGPRCGVRVRH